MEDRFQTRYRAHQQRKAAVLKQILEERHSDRVFDDRPVGDEAMNLIDRAVTSAPSSCDRRAIRYQVVTDRDRKALLGGLLVGGTGWVHRAPVVLLFHAEEVAYKAGDEIRFMPYLDAGVVVGQVLLAASSLGLHACYINPSVRQMNAEHFKNTFGPGLYVGAIALGHKPLSDEQKDAVNGLPPLWTLETS